MLKVKDFATPSPKQWQMVIHGCRNAYKSWNKSDSHLIEINVDSYDSRYREGYIDEKQVDYQDAIDMIQSKDYDTLSWIECEQYFRIGKNDKRLLTMLTSMGTSDRKVLRQLPIILEVKAPLYWWKQADKYQIGTTTNSESTMHTITKYPFTVEDFAVDNYYSLTEEEVEKNLHYSDLKEGFERNWWSGLWGNEEKITLEEFLEDKIIGLLNALRQAYLDTHDKKYWYVLNELLPQSYYQTRTWSLNYEVALSIIDQRMFHDLEEWKTLIVFLLKNVPYLFDLAEADGLIKDTGGGFIYGIKGDKKDFLYRR